MSIKGHTDELARSLKENGINYAFGVSGSGASLELITALTKYGVKYYPVAHEGAGVIMAGACSKSGKPLGVAISIKGPGFVNLIPGITANYFENRPAITISEAYSPTAPSHKMHKRVNHFEISKSILKGFVSADGKKETISNLFNTLSREVPGPGHIELYNDQEQPQDSFLDTKKNNENSSRETYAEILEEIKKSKRPALVLGSLTTRALKDFDFSSLGIPIVTTAAAKGVVDENSAMSAGVITGEVKELSPESNILKEADLIIGIGLRNTEVVAAKPFDAPLVIIDDDVDDALHTGFEAKTACKISGIGDKDIEIFCKEIKGKEWGNDSVEGWRLSLKKALFGDSFMPATAFKVLQSTLDRDTILVLDTGLFCVIGETVWKASNSDQFIGSSIGRFMGTGLPTAIGVSLSNQNKPVVCAMGDGGIRPHISEIKLAVSENLLILFILMSDKRYGSVALSGIPNKLNSDGFDIKNASWREAVNGMGCKSETVSTEEEFVDTLGVWKKGKGPMFVEISFDQDTYLEMTNKLR